ncbi:MAG: TetR/AcrR family transcriptional regulator, partial [Reyranellales bacterium]
MARIQHGATVFTLFLPQSALICSPSNRRRTWSLTTGRLHSDQEVEMTDVAVVVPRGEAVAAEAGNTMVRTDGRNRRAAETRRKIIAAAKAMIAETSVAPTVVGVAKRADVSVRSVFQHFHDVESLFVTVMDSIRSDLVTPAFPEASRPLNARVEDVVKAFAELFDKVVPLRVAAGQFVDHPALVERSQQARNELRAATFEVFAPEFAVLSEQARASRPIGVMVTKNSSPRMTGVTTLCSSSPNFIQMRFS